MGWIKAVHRCHTDYYQGGKPGRRTYPMVRISPILSQMRRAYCHNVCFHRSTKTLSKVCKLLGDLYSLSYQSEMIIELSFIRYIDLLRFTKFLSCRKCFIDFFSYQIWSTFATEVSIFVCNTLLLTDC